MIRNINQTEMTKNSVDTIQGDSNSAVNRDCGQKGGLAAECNGMSQDAQWASIEDIQRLQKLSSASTMVNLILNTNIQTAFVESLSLIKTNLACITVDILNTKA